MLSPNLDPTLLPGYTPPARDDTPDYSPPPLIPGSTTAKTLYHVWKGTPVTVVSSPPGAGKTTLLSHVIAHLWAGTDMRIGIAAVSHAAVNTIAGRIAELTGPNVVYKATGKDRHGRDRLPHNVGDYNTIKGRATQRIILGRVAKAWHFASDELDLIVIDEAWQLTYADTSAVAKNATQVLLIGDPGQTQPIIRGDKDLWRGWDSPASPGPIVMGQRDDAVGLTMPTTFRVGPEAVTALSPLYDFTFTSSRPDRAILDDDHTPMPELVSATLAADTPVIGVGKFLADIAQSYAGRELTGVPGKTHVTFADIAVCVARNATVASVTAALTALNIPVNCADGVTVNTANSLQGGQWHVVVSLDPAHGQDTVSSHAAELGRLCVMASRQMSHLVWVHDNRWRALFTESDVPVRDVKRHLACRTVLTANRITL